MHPALNTRNHPTELIGLRRDDMKCRVRRDLGERLPINEIGRHRHRHSRIFLGRNIDLRLVIGRDVRPVFLAWNRGRFGIIPVPARVAGIVHPERFDIVVWHVFIAPSLPSRSSPEPSVTMD